MYGSCFDSTAKITCTKLSGDGDQRFAMGLSLAALLEIVAVERGFAFQLSHGGRYSARPKIRRALLGDVVDVALEGPGLALGEGLSRIFDDGAGVLESPPHVAYLGDDLSAELV